jgi:hypothetical protein
VSASRAFSFSRVHPIGFGTMRPDALMDQELTAGDKPHVISQQELDDLRALSKRGAETGELFAYEPGTRKVEVYTSAAPGPTPAYVYTLASRPPVVHVPERREPVASPAARPRERRVRRSRGSASRGDPSEPPPARAPLAAAERAYLRAKIDARRREVVRATEKVERSLERHWREDAA